MGDSHVYAITGGTGSLGTALTHHLLAQGHKVRTISRDEHKINALYASVDPKLRDNLSTLVGDVRDRYRLWRAFDRADCVIHAAAMKHVGRCESDPNEAVETNIKGTMAVANACLDAKVKRAVFIGTDKLVSANTLYGMTKACGERLWIAQNRYSAGIGTEFVSVRYGNCFGSAGSVYHVWKEQLANGGITITDGECTRFNFRVPAAVEFVLSALTEARAGTVRIPILPVYRLRDLAAAMAPNAKQTVTGLKPGEKLHELMISEHESLYAAKCDGFWTLGPDVVGGKRFEYSSGASTWRMTVQNLKDEIAWYEGANHAE